MFSGKLPFFSPNFSIYNFLKIFIFSVTILFLKLRRSLETALWSPSDGMLNQLPGVGAATTRKLKDKNIVSYSDVLSQSASALEQAAKRREPFGRELQFFVSKILGNALDLSSGIEKKAGSPNSIIRCHIQPFPETVFPASSCHGNKFQSSAGQSLVRYTLVVYTDYPGGKLFHRKNITSAGEFKIMCPFKFGKIFCRLYSDLCGLDVTNEIEGSSPYHDPSKTKKLPFSPTHRESSKSKEPSKKRKKGSNRSF